MLYERDILVASSCKSAGFDRIDAFGVEGLRRLSPAGLRFWIGQVTPRRLQ